MVEKFIGQQLIVDLYGCDARLLDDLDGLRAFIHRMCDCIHTEIVEESYHKFEPIGVSAYAVITTSHLSIHTWPEFGYAAVDVFSCDGRLTEQVCEQMREALGANEVRTQMIHRRVGEAPSAHPRGELAS